VSHAGYWVSRPLLWKQWGDELVVYDIESGNTHLISPVAAKILRRLDQQPSTLAQVAEYLTSEVDIDSDPELVQHIERLISDLDELGLVKPFNE
jgi:PqqD family protein of HPr-rel-A system